MKIDGQCHCGLISYQAEIDPQNVSICHCTDCQQLTGSAYRVTVSCRLTDFELTGAAPNIYVKHGDNGRRRYQMFCPNCGSPVYTTGAGEDAAEIGIRVGTVNQRRALSPKRQKWCMSALPWSASIEDLPGRPAA